MADPTVLILGAGVTGLAAGYASGRPVYEAAAVPGGICSSYYVRPGTAERLPAPPEDGEAYRFELGGGHWIFGGDPAVLRFLGGLAPMRVYHRRSGVYFREEGRYVPFPLQYHLAALDEATRAAALREIDAPPPETPPETMAAWIASRFGPTLTRRFFGPFHARYTAGLWTEIAPQDPYKSPLDRALVRQGAEGAVPEAGYNVRFLYPEEGLDALARRLAARTAVHYGRRAVEIDLGRRRVRFEDGTAEGYDLLVSTLPLHAMMQMTGLAAEAPPPDPYTSVLVVNVGAERGPRCPDDHWLYLPDTGAGHFRVGCYSNVDPGFLPCSAQERGDRVALYVERAFPGGARPAADETDAFAREVVEELQADGWIGAPEVVDPTWIETAYTWTRPGSRWRTEALGRLEAQGVVMTGRYARWTFQGIADSVRDGLAVGATLREAARR